MKKTTAYILICLLIVMSLVGILIWATLDKKTDEKQAADIEITLDGNTTENLKVDFTDICPGTEKQYVIRLKAENAKDYSIVLKFVGDGKIKDYIDVEITTDGENLAEGSKKLAELLGGDISLGKGATEITIKYSMPLQTGNEAQGAEASFDIELIATL